MEQAADWRSELLAFALGTTSGALTLRDRLSGVTKRLRRHPLAEPFSFSSEERRLAATFVPGEPGVPVMLLCHGIGETVEHWCATQALLRDYGIGSLVFNYSGYGRSTGRVHQRHCAADLTNAYAELRRRVGSALPVFLLGFSLGSGIAAERANALQPRIAGLFLCEAFSSFREAAQAAGVPRWLVRTVPNIWNTGAVLPHLQLPVCVVHSTGDRLFPITMARGLEAHSHGKAELVVIEGFAHNEPFLRAVDRYWEPIVKRVLLGKQN